MFWSVINKQRIMNVMQKLLFFWHAKTTCPHMHWSFRSDRLYVLEMQELESFTKHVFLIKY